MIAPMFSGEKHSAGEIIPAFTWTKPPQTSLSVSPHSSRSVGAMIATPFALATPRVIGAPLAVSSPNLL